MTNNDWWANKLGGGKPNASPTPATGPTPGQVYVPQPQQPNVQVTYDAETDQTFSKARTTRMNDRCPECNSGNYFAPTGTQRMRCYDCGYPVMQQGSGSGMPGGSSAGPTQAARQVGQGGGFNPNVIVDRIG
jgi:ribosomal protein S27AE